MRLIIHFYSLSLYNNKHMDIQELFYTVGVIYMIMSIALILMIAIIFYLVYRKVSDLHNLIQNKILRFVEPAEIAVGVGATVAKTALKKVQKFMDSDKDNKE